jgi:hypothetical protein
MDMQQVAAAPSRKVGRPRGARVSLKRVFLYEETLDQLRSTARANRRSMAKELQAQFARGPSIEEALDLIAQRQPEEGQTACERLFELVGDDRIDRGEAQRAVALFVASPLGRAIQLIGAVDITNRQVLDGLAVALGCSRFEAANWWIALLKVTLPHIHQDYAAQPEIEGGEFYDDDGG